MIGLYNDSGDRLSIVYNGLTLNNDSDSTDDTYEINVVVTGDAWARVEDPRPEDDGYEAGKTWKQIKMIRLEGTLRAPTLAKFYDKRQSLAAAFDAAKIAHENTDPYLAMTFSVPTLDTTNFPTGLVASKYLLLPKRIALPPLSMYSGRAGYFTLEMEAIDPRRYLQSSSTCQVVATGSTSFNNTLADYRSWPTITITATGAGSATYSVGATSDGLTDLTLNLSGLVNTDVVLINTYDHTIKKNGTLAPELYVSGNYFPVEPKTYLNNSLTVANGTNMTTVATWYKAFCD